MITHYIQVQHNFQNGVHTLRKLDDDDCVEVPYAFLQLWQKYAYPEWFVMQLTSRKDFLQMQINNGEQYEAVLTRDVIGFFKWCKNGIAKTAN